MDIQAAQVWSEDMPLSVNLAAEAGYDYYVADYVALTGEANDAFMEKAKKYVTEDEIGAINRYTYVTYAALHAMAEAMKGCGEDLTRKCTIENLRKMENFDVGGIVAPLSFNNEKQLSGTALAVYQIDAETKAFTQKTDFIDY